MNANDRVAFIIGTMTIRIASLEATIEEQAVVIGKQSEELIALRKTNIDLNPEPHEEANEKSQE